MIKQKFHGLVRDKFCGLGWHKALVDEVTYDLMLSNDELKQLNDAEDSLKTSLQAHDKMRELQFSSTWKRIGMASDQAVWAMAINKVKADLETYICVCIDVVAKGARSFGALEAFRRCLADKAEDIKKRAFGLIDQRDRPLLDSHISKVASDRVTQWQNWADRELKPSWMAQSEASRGNTERNSQVAKKVESAELERNISAERDVREPGTAPAPLAKLISPAQFGGNGQKKRGRPAIIPDERKQAAVECKANGGTNRDAAMLIYDRKYPTPQQVKNVSSILRNHQQGSKRRNSTSSVRPKTSSKAQQK